MYVVTLLRKLIDNRLFVCNPVNIKYDSNVL